MPKAKRVRDVGVIKSLRFKIVGLLIGKELQDIARRVDYQAYSIPPEGALEGENKRRMVGSLLSIADDIPHLGGKEFERPSWH